MMVKIRELLNPLILNDIDNIGFFGDSEYYTVNGCLVMGYWEFIGIEEDRGLDKSYFCLDDFVDINDLLINYGGVLWVVNDSGMLCIVRFTYH